MSCATFPTQPDPPIDPAVALQASQWMITLMSPDAAARDHDACTQWRAQHPEHERAWQHVQAVWQSLAALPADLGRAVLRQPRRVINPARRHVLGVAAATLVLGGAVAWRCAKPGADGDAYATGTGERRHIQLADGTHVELDTASAIDVRLDAAARRIIVRAGAIQVTTGRDTLGRPLYVDTEDGTLRPIGTRFTVRRLPDGGTRVGVQEGAVEIRPAAAPDATRLVRAGERMRFTRLAIDASDAQDDTNMDDAAWVRGMLAVHEMPLETFLAELGRYRPGWVRCAPDVAALRVSGVFPIDDTGRVLEALPHVLPVQVRTLSRYWVMVSARD
ncbi:FecR domain-containing protein [Ralstonia sp. ASV6]|uniref:FecR domain-containing protein n=1 Tax=Ralstonia sp. ASV6 TaxID=2795124 RepID=UPI0018ECF7FA|nr:FecR domain-containing protein [Ralstonia sp. ASV6]